MPRLKNISLKLDASGKKPALSDFANACSALRTCLNLVSKSIANKDVEFEIRDLHTSSAVIAVAPVQNGVPTETLLDIENTFLGTVRAIQNGEPLDPRLEYHAVRAFLGFASPVRKEGVSLKIGDISLTRQYVANIAELLEPVTPSLGSVTGRLEAVSVHDTYRFTLYPPVAGEEIECNFETSELERVLRAVNQTVTVFGTLHYAKSKSFPVLVDATDFVVEPDESALPTLLNARGLLGTSGSTHGAWRDEW